MTTDQWTHPDWCECPMCTGVVDEDAVYTAEAPATTFPIPDGPVESER